MERITEKHLNNEIKAINEKLNPAGNLVGSFELSSAYGGWSLVQIVNEGRGVRPVLGDYHRPKRELFEQMRAFNAGLELAMKAAFNAGINAQVSEPVNDW